DSGAEPGRGLVAYLANLLNSSPIEDVQSVYIAFEKKNWKEKDALLRVDRQSFPHAALVRYDYHDPTHEWYNGPKSTGEAYLSEPFLDAGSSKTLISISKRSEEHTSELQSLTNLVSRLLLQHNKT